MRLVLLLCVIGYVESARYTGLKLKMSPAHVKTKEEVCGGATVEVGVSAQLDKNTSRRLLVSWWVPHAEPADMIALYVTDPAVDLTSPAYTLSPATATGWSLTPLRETYLDYWDTFSPVCLGYWVVYWRGHNKIASSCLQTNPSWMSDHRESLGHFRLFELFIPGSHDSAAYSVTYQPRDLSRYEKYVYTQEESVLSQLLHGIRYLDLRLGYHKDKGFYAHHSFVKLGHFQGVIDDVILFLKNSNDIVVMDMHHFPVGFKNDDVHLEFVKYLERELSEYMATPALSWYASLEDVWRTGKRLIVSYNNKKIVSKGVHKVWRPVKQQWGDVRTVEQLRHYFESVFKKPPLEAWAAMAELTPTRWDFLTDTLGGLRVMAANTNQRVSDWFRHSWGLRCNIVAVDFFRSSSIVAAAIDLNLFKAFNLCT